MVDLRRGEKPFPAVRVDEVDGGGADNIGAGARCLHGDVVVPLCDPELGLCRCSRENAGMSAMALWYLFTLTAANTTLPVSPQIVVGVDELVRHYRADAGAVRVHELQHHDLATEGG